MEEIVKKEKMTFEKLKSDMINSGFEVDGDVFRKVVITGTNRIVVNGKTIEKPIGQILQITYTGEGGVLGEDSDTIEEPMFFFDMNDDDGEITGTFSVYDIDDFYSLFNLK